jgi:hypothetical protein
MTDSDEGEYLLNEGQTWFLALVATPEDGARNATEIKHEVVKVLMAWRRDKLLPRWEVPHLAGFCDDFNRMEQGLPVRPLRKDEDPPPAPPAACGRSHDREEPKR